MANGGGRYHSKPYCNSCRVRHQWNQWNQHVSTPSTHKRASHPSSNRSNHRPKASGVTSSMSDDSDHGMHSPLVYDTAATHSIFSSRDQFADYQNIDGKVTVVGGGKSVGRGIAKIGSLTGRTIKLRNSYHVPSARDNLISHRAIMDTNLNLSWTADKGVKLTHSDGAPALLFRTHGRRLVHTHPCQKPNDTPASASATQTNMRDLHSSFGHPGRDAGNRIAKKLGVKYQHPDQCKVCSKAKMTLKPHTGHIPRGNAFLDTIHIHLDIVGGRKSFPSVPPGVTDSSPDYYLLIVDGFTNFTWIYPLYRKTEADLQFKAFLAMCKTQFAKTPKQNVQSANKYRE